MGFKFFSATLGLFLIAFGFSLQPLHSNGESFSSHRVFVKEDKGPTPDELRISLRRCMTSQEKALYNQVRHIVADTDLTIQEKIEEIVILSESKGLSKVNRGMILNSAVILAQNTLQGEEREEALKKLHPKNMQAKWFLKKNPNPNLLKLSRLQYSILTASEDI